MKKKWNLKSDEVVDCVNDLLRKFVDRRTSEMDDPQAFLNPNMSRLTDPFLINGMTESVDRIYDAIKSDEMIIVYSDYDVDGTTSCAIMVRFLTLVGANFTYHVPNRMTDGYGLNIKTLEHLKEKHDPKLIITVDNGITAIEQVQWLNDNNIDVVITDHHLPGDELPDTKWLVNPVLQEGESFQYLCGCGVAFKVCWALSVKLSDGRKQVDIEYKRFLISMLPIVAVATVADMVPLIHENRSLVKEGLSLFSNSIIYGDELVPGLKALADVVDLSGVVSTTNIGFDIGPRLNAAGRLGNADIIVELLTSTSKKKSFDIAKAINKLNKTRKTLCSGSAEEALSMAQDYSTEDHILVLYGPDWHKGVLGIIASRVVDATSKPCVILSGDGDIVGGSCRSVDGFNIREMLDYCSDLLVRFGGHSGAAGVALEECNIDAFRTKANEYARSLFGDELIVPTVDIDFVLDPTLIELKTFNRLKRLEPYGHSNPKPIFLSHGLKIDNVRQIGGDKAHLKINFVGGYEGFGPGLGHLYETVAGATTMSAVYVLNINTWRGKKTLSLQIQDLRCV